MLLQKDNEFIEEYSKECYNKYCKVKAKQLEVSKKLFVNEMEAVVTRVIIKAFKEISNCHQNFEMKHIYEIVNLAKNSTVVVIGLGSIGLLMGQALKAYEMKVIGCDLLDERIDFARELGFDDGFNSHDMEKTYELVNVPKKLKP